MREIIFMTIWEFLSDDRELRPSMTGQAGRLTDQIMMAIDEANTIQTVDALHDLPVPTSDDLAGVLIKSIALVDPDNGTFGLGEVYERNTDGTWCMLQDPSGADWGERQVPSRDIPLPAMVLWGL
jgi:hypothetical protein